MSCWSIYWKSKTLTLDTFLATVGKWTCIHLSNFWFKKQFADFISTCYPSYCTTSLIQSLNTMVSYGAPPTQTEVSYCIGCLQCLIMSQCTYMHLSSVTHTLFKQEGRSSTEQHTALGMAVVCVISNFQRPLVTT